MIVQALLLAILKANLAASVLIPVVLATRRSVRKAFGARVAYSLWLTPLIGSVAVLIPARISQAPAEPLSQAPLPQVITDAADFVAAAPDAAPIDWTLLGAAVWTLGLVLSLGWLILRQAKFLKDARRGRAGPAVVGFIKPRVVIPADFNRRFEAHERRVVLTHEDTHLVRQDARVAAAAALIRCVNWFNPLVHVAVAQMRLDQELACDAQVIAAHPDIRRTYAEAMLKAGLGSRALPLGCAWPNGSLHPLAERIALLTENGPSRARVIGGAALVAVAGLGCGAIAWAAQPARPAVLEEVRVSLPVFQGGEALFAPTPGRRRAAIRSVVHAVVSDEGSDREVSADAESNETWDAAWDKAWDEAWSKGWEETWGQNQRNRQPGGLTAAEQEALQGAAREAQRQGDEARRIADAARGRALTAAERRAIDNARDEALRQGETARRLGEIARANIPTPEELEAIRRNAERARANVPTPDQIRAWREQGERARVQGQIAAAAAEAARASIPSPEELQRIIDAARRDALRSVGQSWRTGRDVNRDIDRDVDRDADADPDPGSRRRR